MSRQPNQQSGMTPEQQRKLQEAMAQYGGYMTSRPYGQASSYGQAPSAPYGQSSSSYGQPSSSYGQPSSYGQTPSYGQPQPPSSYGQPPYSGGQSSGLSNRFGAMSMGAPAGGWGGQSSTTAAPSAAARTSTEFNFGIEIEMTIQPQLTAIYRDFARARVDYPRLAQGEGILQQRWYIEEDKSIRPEDGYFGVEVVSPILVADPNRSWVDQVRNVWRVINTYFRVRQNRSCGFHVHFSPAEGNWNLRDLKALSKAILFYDPVIDGILPDERRGILWCPSVIFQPLIKAEVAKIDAGRSYFRNLFDAVDRFSSADQLIEFISPRKLSSWNFQNLRRTNLGTVEFRRPPGVTTPDETIAWVDFTLAFRAAAMDGGYFQRHVRDLEGIHRRGRLEELQGFLSQGATLARCDTAAINRLFNGKSYNPGMTREPPRPTTQDQQTARSKEQKSSPMNDKVLQLHQQRR
ncbi:hypothetical protein TWF481_001890 [Arthrobotrys musiformis]|uniref:Amidoligase enzyme n=1 Tax=Arthrobotrys musiformis TaxID=47236 RepID=A0AAV9VWN6_9PEZI